MNNGPQECRDDICQMRREYAGGRLRREDLKPNPIEQFAIWFRDACHSQIIEPNAMSLATATAEGFPSLRTVLLKGFDERGFLFFTNLESRKAEEIAGNPNVSLLFPWLKLERQVIVCGTAQQISKAEAVSYFLSRPFASRVAAWVSAQSKVISSRQLLEAQWEEMKRKFASGRVPLPSFWGGYRVRPRQIEFWQGGPHRLHDRFLYTRQHDDSWAIQRLAP